MIFKSFRAGVTALVLGTAAVAAASIALTGTAEAALRSAVGKPLSEAKSLAASGNYSAALARVNAAEAVGSLTGEERTVINQMREYIEIKSGSGALGVKAKFANDYSAGRSCRAVIDDAELLRRGRLDANAMQVIAQAYCFLHDHSGCGHYMNSFGSGAARHSYLTRCCAYEAQTTVHAPGARNFGLAPTGGVLSQLLNTAQGARAQRPRRSTSIVSSC
jgi:hypothetical protein